MAKKIFLIEDDQFFARLLKGRLEKAGFEVVAERDGEKALVMLKEEKPDLILMEIVLPGISGFEILSEMRANPAEYGSAPVIVVTNLAQESDVAKGMSLGVAAYLIKGKTTVEGIVKSAEALL